MKIYQHYWDVDIEQKYISIIKMQMQSRNISTLLIK